MPTHARSPRPPGTRRLLGLCVTGALAWLVAGPVASVGALVLATVSPGFVHRRRRARDRRWIDAEVATVFEVAARSVRAGAAVPDALQRAARSVGGSGGRAVAASLGASMRSAGTDGAVGRSMWAGGHQGGSVTGPRTGPIVAAVLAMVHGAAGGGARGLEAGAVLLREHERSRVEIDAGATHARASATLLVVVPPIFGGVALMWFPGAAGSVLSHPAALASVVVGACMEATGAWWTTRLVRSVHGGPR
jgi:Flp pilus assembly protein TadB